MWSAESYTEKLDSYYSGLIEGDSGTLRWTGNLIKMRTGFFQNFNG